MIKIDSLTTAEQNTFKRKQAIRDKYDELEAKHSKWRFMELIKEIATKHHHWSERTIINALSYKWEHKMIDKYGSSIMNEKL